MELVSNINDSNPEDELCNGELKVRLAWKENDANQNYADVTGDATEIRGNPTSWIS